MSQVSGFERRSSVDEATEVQNLPVRRRVTGDILVGLKHIGSGIEAPTDQQSSTQQSYQEIQERQR